jgi:hypothetical protein
MSRAPFSASKTARCNDIGSSTIRLNDEPGTLCSQAVKDVIPVENVIAAQKWSRLNHAVATFRGECGFVGWLRLGSD